MGSLGGGSVREKNITTLEMVGFCFFPYSGGSLESLESEERKTQGAAKGVRQKEFDHFFSFSGRFRSLFGHFF